MPRAGHGRGGASRPDGGPRTGGRRPAAALTGQAGAGLSAESGKMGRYGNVPSHRRRPPTVTVQVAGGIRGIPMPTKWEGSASDNLAVLESVGREGP